MTLEEKTTIALPPFTDEGVIFLELQSILDSRWIKQGTRLIEESLVQWKHLPAEEATWEPTQQIRMLFPAMNLVDKAPLVGGKY